MNAISVLTCVAKMSRSTSSLAKKLPSNGFTLIELMITVAVIGILASIAYPSYQEHVRKTRRSDAQAVMLENAQGLERFFASNNTYSGASLISDKAPKEGATQYYGIAVGVSEDGLSYDLTATPAGAQVGDRCGNMTLSSTGAKGATMSDCWQR